MINVRIQAPEVNNLSPKITVLGVGGAGGNAVNNMIQSNLEGCEFIVCNTDSQALEGSLCEKKIQLGTHVTGGLGAGANPEIGRQAAEESLDEVLAYLENVNMAFITAGMGGGTGTGAAPVLAKAARDAGVLTVGVVTKPFHFEGTHRMKMAEAGIAQMQDFVDTLIVIPNQNLFRIANEKTTFADAFKMADSVLQSGVRGVTDLMVMPGLINLDFADIRSAMLEMGKAMMGTGEAEGDRRAIEAAEAAINNPLLDDVSMKGARGVIINVTGGSDMTLFEVDEACNRIRDEVDPNANIIFGSTFEEKLDGRMRVSVVATGIDVAEMKKTTPSGVKVTSVVRKPLSQQITQAPVSAVPEKPIVNRVAPSAQSMERAQSQIQQRPAQVSMQRPSQFVTSHDIGSISKPFKADDPESDMFEQQDLMESSQMPKPQVSSSAMRGTVQQGQFIPPAPMVPERQSPAIHAGRFTPQLQQPNTSSPQPFMPAEQSRQEKSFLSQAEQQQSGLVLRPPVPGQNASERKQTPSLFERITGVRRGGEQSKSGGNTSQSGQQNAGFMSGLQAKKNDADLPSQGSLNIDSPSAPKRSEEELDIPAFLRRQAN